MTARVDRFLPPYLVRVSNHAPVAPLHFRNNGENAASSMELDTFDL